MRSVGDQHPPVERKVPSILIPEQPAGGVLRDPILRDPLIERPLLTGGLPLEVETWSRVVVPVLDHQPSSVASALHLHEVQLPCFSHAG
jgi:hypothetical protein